MAVGIEDVARRAGVSIATVSRALRGLPNVSPSTREKVRAAAEELGYKADPNAARLASGRSSTLGIVVPALDSWFFGKVAAGAAEVFEESGHDLLLFAKAPGQVADAFVQRPDLSKHVGGLLLVDLPLGEEARRELARGPVHAVGITATSGITPSVGIDDAEVGRVATGHLVELGHRRIGFIGATDAEARGSSAASERRRAWEEVLEDAGLARPVELATSGGFTMAGGYTAARQLLGMADPPTAIFVISDEMAVGALRACRDLDHAVPGDVSIVGVDDHEIAAVVELTTVRQDPSEHGRVGAHILVGQLSSDGPRAHGHVSPAPAADVWAPPELVVRGSTAPPPG